MHHGLPLWLAACAVAVAAPALQKVAGLTALQAPRANRQGRGGVRVVQRRLTLTERHLSEPNDPDDYYCLQTELDAEDLGRCHGMLYASGVRHVSDVKDLTEKQMKNMGLGPNVNVNLEEKDKENNPFMGDPRNNAYTGFGATSAAANAIVDRSNDRKNLLRVRNHHSSSLSKKEQVDYRHSSVPLSTTIRGAFEPETLPNNNNNNNRFEVPAQLDFQFETVHAEHGIFRGRLFTPEQCEQIKRRVEYHAYRHDRNHTHSHLAESPASAGWTNEHYTLTAQHLPAKEVPGLLGDTKDIFRQLQAQMYHLFPGGYDPSSPVARRGRIRPGSIRPADDNEPHLVKYQFVMDPAKQQQGLADSSNTGCQLHVDNSKFLYITLNVVLSDPAVDFEGGGTYIQALDETISLNQGEMLIHLGDLWHAGMDITAGVRLLLIGFYACEWE